MRLRLLFPVLAMAALVACPPPQSAASNTTRIASHVSAISKRVAVGDVTEPQWTVE